MFNLDETHFVLDQANGKALGILGESKVNNAEVSNGSEILQLCLLCVEKHKQRLNLSL